MITLPYLFLAAGSALIVLPGARTSSTALRIAFLGAEALCSCSGSSERADYMIKNRFKIR